MAWTYRSAHEAALAVAPVVATHRFEADTAARMAPEVRAAMGEVGLFAVAVPELYGGRESTLPDLVAAIGVIAEADPAAAWHLSNTIAVPSAAAHLGSDARAEVFSGDLTRPFCVSNSPAGRAVPVEGGFVLNGDWPFLTGVLEAEWALLAATFDGGERPRVGLAVVPTSTLEIKDTWPAAAAMRGTGSNAASVRELFVEQRFATGWWAPLDLDRPLYRISIPALTLISTGAVALGVLDACLAATLRLVGTRVSRADGVAFMDKPRVQEAIGEAEAASRALRAGYLDAMALLWERAMDHPLTPRDEGPAFASTFRTIDGARDMVSRLYLAATPTVYATANIVERSLRDIFAISVGVEALRDFTMQAGRRLLNDAGAPPTSTTGAQR